jgi:uncharacterized protein YjbI with pentapeptide repeats
MPLKVVNDAGVKVAWLAGRVPPHALSASLIAKVTLAMVPGGVCQWLPEDDMLNVDGDKHVGDDETKSLTYASDFALFKPFADVLLKGSAHAPEGQNATVLRATFGVGAWTKTVAVIGDRVWNPGAFSAPTTEPQPFTSMPLTWEHAFGGPRYRFNPCGRGMDPVPGPDGRPMRPAPNLEYLEDLMMSPSDKPDPACFAPVAVTWPQRISKAGTYSKKYREESWPWFPPDFDWSLFNSAPSDQQLPHYLRGDETIVLENLHPVHRRYETTLPGMAIRWFMRQEFEDKKYFEEIPMNLDTLFVDADEGRVVLIWRGIAAIRSLKMREVTDHFIVREPLGTENVGLAHFRQRLRDRKTEIAEANQPAPPAPPEMPAIPLMPAIDLSWVEPMKKEMADLEAKILGLRDNILKENASLFAEAKIDPAIMTSSQLKPAGFPNVLAELRNLEQSHAAIMKTLSPDKPAALTTVPLAKQLAWLKEVEAEFNADVNDRATAEPAAEAPVVRPVWTRERVQEHAGTGGTFADENLAGLDLSGLDLTGADFSVAELAGCNFEKCELSNAVFRASVLTGARFVQANLSDAMLVDAAAAKADFTGAQLRGADLSRLDASDANFTGATLESARAKGAVFGGSDFTGAGLGQSAFISCDFSECSLNGANFKHADLASSDFGNADAEGINLTGTKLEKMRAAGARMPGAMVVGAKADGSIWEGANLEGASFAHASLSKANFIEANLGGASFYMADMREARLADARCDGAQFVKTNLFRSTFEGAALTGADCRESNFYEAEFYNAAVSGADFEFSNLKGTKLA